MNSEIMIGTWAWGNKKWNYGINFNKENLDEMFLKAIQQGFLSFDTAIGYRDGKRILGELIERHNVQNEVKIASKIMPYPWRYNPKIFESVVKRHIFDLGLNKIFLLQIHRPLPPFPIENWVEKCVCLKEEGLIEHIGISNCNTEEMLRAHEKLKDHGLELYSNQIQFNLVNPHADAEGMREAANINGIKLYAYSPLARGLLSGYRNSRPLEKSRKNISLKHITQVEPLLDLMENIRKKHNVKSIEQVALKWIMQKGIVPIVGTKKSEHINSYKQLAVWELDNDEMEILNKISLYWLS
ncbi:aldo/keto reductase [Lysinibacillus sp. NPDC093692]|uniref:aldo/keto reductase n=1 Tax=Lysinibacillus sp. NPDC093692 TaxID=3390578 RepID=UPI003D01A976